MEARRRVREMQREADLFKAKLGPRLTSGVFKSACSTDLLFLIDSTGSMRSYIDSAKEQVKNIVADVKAQFFREAEVRIAVVSYKDHDDDPNVEFLDFTTSTSEVYDFIDGLKARGGKDAPEDVLGGIDQALKASWQQQTRCIIHIADAPAHGRNLHHLKPGRDNYYEPGSEPHRLTYEPLVKRMVQLHLNYGFLRINSSTDRMVFAFSQIYVGSGAAARLLTTNPNRSLSTITATPNAQLQFEEMELGSQLSDIRRLVVESISKSVSSTATRIFDSPEVRSGSGRRVPSHVGKPSGLGKFHKVVSVETVQLESVAPQWQLAGWLDKTWHVQGFCPDVVHDAGTLSDMIASDDAIKLSFAELDIHARSLPFSKGGVRFAHYARTAASNNRFVLKTFIKTGQGRATLVEEMRMQALCKSFALEFNSLLKLAMPVDFVVTTCVQPSTHTSPDDGFMFLEPYIEGEYIKYNGNNGYVHDDQSHSFFDTAQAFSHFTFERSWGQMLVNDLQGVNNILTDPAIQTKNPSRFNLSQTNLNVSGFKLWFSYHVCNDICRRLGLKSKGEMFLTNKFEFRETWPSMERTTCCSSKFCRKIIPFESASTSAEFPGFHWCGECWPQLITVQRDCLEEGEDAHTFDVSDFFHESQGELSPSRCPRHRVKETARASMAAVGGSLFNAMRAASTEALVIDGRNW